MDKNGEIRLHGLELLPVFVQVHVNCEGCFSSEIMVLLYSSLRLKQTNCPMFRLRCCDLYQEVLAIPNNARNPHHSCNQSTQMIKQPLNDAICHTFVIHSDTYCGCQCTLNS